MQHAKLFFAAATVLFGSVTALWAEPLPASNSTEISTPDLGPSPLAAPPDSTAAAAVVPPSPVAEIAGDPGMTGAPQEVKADPIGHVAHAVPLRRPVAHRARLGCYCSHPSARVAKRAMPRRFAASQAAAWLVASNEPQRYVVLGVGY